MTGSWTEGYCTQLAYTYGYYREMCPQHIRFCLLTRKMPPPPSSGFTYCELAMGNGFSANIHAAANHGLFTGMDFHPDHASFAAGLADRSGTGLRVTDDSFEDFLAKDHPGYDYICLHGGWSWISGRNRELVVAFLQQHLKPGGVFYLSYNCYPGWSVTAPLRELFMLFDDNYGVKGVNPATRINNAVALTGELLQAHPLYLETSPWIMERFEGLREASPEYLAHEFFNADWDIMYFKDVSEILAEAKLRFAASATAQNNIPGFGLTEEARRFMSRVENPIVYQQAWDFFCNTQFRTDIFIKGGTEMTELQSKNLLLEERFCLIGPIKRMQYTIQCGMGTFQMDEKPHTEVAEILADDGYRPKTLKEILERVSGRMTFEQLLGIVTRLIGKGYVQPCQPADTAAGRREHCARLNEELVNRAESSDDLRYLASPETGGGIILSRPERLFLHALRNSVDPVDHVLDVLRQNREHVTHNDEEVTDPVRAKNVLAETYGTFMQDTLPALRGLGVVDA